MQLLQRPWAAELPWDDDWLEVSFDDATTLGLAPEALVDDDWVRCQEWAATLDVPAIVVPSAALPGTSNVVMFGPLVRSTYGRPPIDTSVDLPCDPIADLSSVAADLCQHVRWRGQAHAGYEAWQQRQAVPELPLVRMDALA